jgi:F-type H+-transporting ATPase subunit alpha
MDVPFHKVKVFVREFIDTLELRHEDIFKDILKNKFTEEMTSKIREVALDVASHFKSETEEQ